jgi:hypothetical protein
MQRSILTCAVITQPQSLPLGNHFNAKFNFLVFQMNLLEIPEKDTRGLLVFSPTQQLLLSAAYTILDPETSLICPHQRVAVTLDIQNTSPTSSLAAKLHIV